MTKNQAIQAKKHLAKLQKIISQNPTPIFRMNKDEAIRALRKTRETIWKEKVALRH